LGVETLLLVGGTGLYIRSIVQGMKIPRVAPQPELRSQLESLGQIQLYQILRQVDAIAAQKIHANDLVRTLRALEVYYATGIPISGIAGDQQSALFGQTCFEPGMTKNTYGTGSFILMNVGTSCPEPTAGMLTTVAWSLTNPDGSVTSTYALEGAIFVTGAAVQWLRDGLEIISTSADIGPLAESVNDNGGIYLVPAFTGLGSPWWDPYARGTLIGITRGTNRAHIARAVVEAMALQTRDAVEAMQQASGTRIAELRVDGGASVMNLLLTLQADQLGITVRRPLDQETTALGAAFLAGLAENIWPSLEALSERWVCDLEVAPHEPDSIERILSDALHQTWLNAVTRSRDWAEQLID
jgi:glycerol kinase